MGSGSCDNFSMGLAWIIADINLLSIDALEIDFESKSEADLFQRVLLCIFTCSLADAFSHMNDSPTFFEAHVIHQLFHQVDATAMSGTDVFGGCRIRHLINVKSSSLVLYRD